MVKDGDEIAGVAIARAVDASQDVAHYKHDYNAPDAFVDLTVTCIDGKPNPSSLLAMKRLLSILWDEFGPRRSLIFNRNGVRKQYDYMKFMRKAMA